ncbi:MAG: DegT/DnrJ/EryC1/StrS family aminotransferase [Candidatus Hadarchaeum sp.]|uniref:DegT/DnrJ/EryC1/StrS family aminotransferase n=1 Tax=Candidatus Hadarchaeum sp. TaxID=2883567 RepID=UPI00316CFE4E
MARLAINGGIPTVPKEKLTPWPILSERDREYVNQVLNSGILAGAFAPQVKALQEEFAEYLGVRYCIAVNSGTAALHMAVAAAGIGPGDEVITSAFSFLASATAAMHQGAIPVFVDIDAKTYNMDPRKVEEKVSDRTKAIIVVHIHGLPADMDEIRAIARRHKLLIIEDAAQAAGATYKGEKVGTIGDIGAFSLNQTKNFQAGEGGLFVTDNKEFWLRADMVRMFGEQVRENERRSYVAHTLGWNYRMPELTAAVARAQLTRLEEVNENGRRNANILNKSLEKIEGIEPPFCPQDRTHTYHKYRVRLSPERMGLKIKHTLLRDKVLLALQAEGVPAVLWQTFPLPANPLFQKKQGFGKGFPWSFPGARMINYDPSEYPETIKLLNASIVIGSERYPIFAQSQDTVELWGQAIEKVFLNLDEVLETVEVPEEEAFALGEITSLR